MGNILAAGIYPRLTSMVLFILLLLIVVPGSAHEGHEHLPEPPEAIERVIVMSLDGMRPDALVQMKAPNLLALAESGAYTWQARTVLPSVTLPAHASMLTGLSVEQHGVIFNDRILGCEPIEPLTFPTVSAMLDIPSAIVAGKEKFCHFHQDEAVNYTFVRNGDTGVADRVLQLLDEDYRVIFAHFPNPDYFGHLSGWMSPEYLANVLYTDAQVGRVLDAIAERELWDETLVIVTADHGGSEYGHGSNSPEDRLIPWMIAGAGVEPGTALESDIDVADTAATVYWVLGLDLPDPREGEPVLEAFGLKVEEKDN